MLLDEFSTTNDNEIIADFLKVLVELCIYLCLKLQFHKPIINFLKVNK